MSAIGGFVFAAFFNIPARRRFLSVESQARNKAVIYDALNFLVFYITFVMAQGLIWLSLTGNPTPLVDLTAWFVTYSLSFWITLKAYMYWKKT